MSAAFDTVVADAGIASGDKTEKDIARYLASRYSPSLGDNARAAELRVTPYA